MGKEVVRTGYDVIAREYVRDRRLDARQLSLLQDLADHLHQGARVLDAGCGAGVPITRWLSERFRVIGVDISEEQIRLAREFVPEAAFLCRDMTALDFPDGSFDAICSFYAVIHVPREEHAALLQNFARMLRPGGVALVCLGAGDWPGEVEGFYGAPMYWSHFDAETNLRLLQDAGFTLLRHEIVPDSLDPEIAARHLFVLAQKPPMLHSSKRVDKTST